MMKNLIVLSITLLLLTSANAQSHYQIIKKVASDRASLDRFGYSVAISGDYAIVGAWQEDEDAAGNNYAFNSGAAYIFKKNQGGIDNWGLVKKIVAADRASEDYFGYSVAISGDYVVVGAYKEDENAVGLFSYPEAGSAYIFKKDQGGTDNWGQIKKIVNSDRISYDHFGWSVSISGDYVVVGAVDESHDINGLNYLYRAGSAYIFKKNQGGTDNWGQIKKIVNSDRESFDLFGHSTSISGDYIVIGALEEDDDINGANSLSQAGAAYIFKKNQGGTDNWGQVKKMVASDRDMADQFGNSVSISGDFVIVGAHRESHDLSGMNYQYFSGSAYIFEKDNGGIDNWGEVKKIIASDRNQQDNFGWSVGISGNFAIVGAINEDHDAAGGSYIDYAGSAYIFKKDQGGANNWGQSQKIVASDRTLNDKFGSSVAISGNYEIIGAFQASTDTAGLNYAASAGAAYIFKINGIQYTGQSTCSVANQTSCQNDIISIPIIYDGVSDLKSINIKLSFDTSKLILSMLSDVNNNLSPTSLSTPTASNINAQFVINWSNPLGKSFGNNDTLVVLNFLTKNTGFAAIVWDSTYGGINALGGIPVNTTFENAIINIIPSPIVQISGNPIICEGNSVSLTATGGTFYQWSNGQNTASITVNPTQTTIYSVIVTGANNCFSTDYLTIMVNTPTTTIAQNNDTLISTEANSYQWYLNSVSILNATNQTLTMMQNGNYYVETIDSNGCFSVSNVLNILNVSTFHSLLDDIKIYPNPAENYLTLENCQGTITVYNLLGQVEKEVIIKDKTEIINISELVKGQYILHLTQNDGRIGVYKFIK